MVAILVKEHHQPLSEAWRFTFREFLMVADLKHELEKRTRSGCDLDRADAMKAHLRNLGIEV